MKRTTSDSFFFKPRPDEKKRSRAARKNMRERTARFEPLEARTLLAVSLAEYASIRAAYEEFELPESANSVNIIEIPAADLSISSLKDAIEQAGSTKKDDLIVVRTTNAANTIAFTKASDQITVELDYDIFGKTTIVALGPKQLLVDAKGFSRAMTVAVGTLQLGNVALKNGVTTDFGGLLYNKGELALKNCAFSDGSAGSSEFGANLYSSGTVLAVNSSFTNAKGGYSLYSTGALTLKGCSVDSNVGAGIYVESETPATLSSCSISNNGSSGFVNKYGSVELLDCTISGNAGAGVLNSGDATIKRTLVSQNAASGILNQSFKSGDAFISATISVELSKIIGNENANGAGAYNFAGKLTLSNCEIAQNVASNNGGALYSEFQQGYLNLTTLVNCTVAANSAANQGGGLFVDSPIGTAVYNTIVSMNFAGQLDANVSGAFISKNNLIGSSASFVVAPIFNYATGRILNAKTLDLRLAAGSAAVNIGDSSRVANGTLDLAGNPRIFGKSVDAGAYEYRNTGEQAYEPKYVVTTLDDSFNLSDTVTSLREALFFANDPAAVITFAQNLTGVLALNSQLVVSSPITVNGGQRITIDAQNNSRAFLVEAPLTLDGITLVNGTTSGNGGLVHAKGALTLNKSILDGGICGADALGGLVYATGAFNATETIFKNSSSETALYLAGTSSLTRCVVRNVSKDALFTSAALTVDGSSIFQNGRRGIVNNHGNVTLRNANIYENGSAGVYNLGAALIENSKIEKNADSGVFNDSVVISDKNVVTSTVTVKNSVIRKNAAQNGAGVYNKFGVVELVNCEISANAALSSGGGVYNDVHAAGANSVRITNCTVAGNYAGVKGGGVAASTDNALLILYNTIVSMNLAGDRGSNVSGDISLSNYSLVGSAPGFVVAPIFDHVEKKLTNPDAIDLRLTSNSAAVNAGSYAYVGPGVTTDLLRNPRVYGTNVDLGAYEYQGTGEVSPEPSYVVTTLVDNFDLTDNKTSLREALYWANQDGKTITFASSLTGTINLKSQLIATNKITINGGSRITINGQSKTRVMLNEGNLTLANVTLTNGSAPSLGNIIYSQGKLTLDNVIIAKGKSAGSGPNGNIYALDSLTVRNSTIADATTGSGVCAFGSVGMTNAVIEGNASHGLYLTNNARLTSCTIRNNAGSGIYNNFGTVELKSVTLSGNTGAGLTNRGSATISTSSVLNNKASGLVNISEVYSETARFSSSLKVYTSLVRGNATSGSGAGVYNLGGMLEIDNSEVSGNTAQGYGGGIYSENLPDCINKTNVVNCSIAGNYAGVQGGGVYVDPNGFILNMYNSIVARNFSPLPNANVEGTVTESVRNITAGNPSFIVAPVFSDAGVLQNADSFDLRLNKESVAIDIGVNEYVVGIIDLDGNDRIFNNAVDLGAYEYFTEGSTYVTTLDDSFDLNDDVVSLREALYFAKRGECVVFDPALRGTIYLTQTLEINKNVSIVANGRITLDGKGQTQILKNYAALSLSGLTFANGYSDGQAGAVYNEGVLDIDACAFKNNQAKIGGAIYNRKNATASVLNSSFTGNAASTSGGAVYNASALTVRNTRFTNNASQQSGGALYSAGQMTIVNSALVNSTAATSGGALYHTTGALALVNCTIAKNTATSGGGLYINSGTAKLYNDIVAMNSTDIAGATSNLTAVAVLSSFTFANQTQNYKYNAANSLFVNANAGVFLLADDSQALDKGSTQYAREYGIGAYSFDLAGSARYIGAKIDLGAYENANAVDITVQENCAFELAVDVVSGDKVYWDLSGTGTGAFVATSASFYVDALKQGLTPGVYYLRSKVVGKDGKTKSENTVTLQVLKSAPLVSAEIMPTLFDNAIVIAFDARFFGQIPDRSWRVDWGDGSSSVSYKDAFTAGRFYEKTDRSVAYSIALTLVSGDGLDEYVYNVAQFTVPGTEDAVSGAIQELEEEEFDAVPVVSVAEALNEGETRARAFAEMFLPPLNQDVKKKDSRFDAVESAWEW